MIKDDLNNHPKAIWIHFYKDCMKLMDMDNTVKAIETPKMPYHHPRMVLADFEQASATLKALMKHHSQGFSFFKITPPIVIVQIMEPIPHGLASIEIRAFKELFWGAGAREIKLYDIDGKSIESE
jgi:hypothetical protein